MFHQSGKEHQVHVLVSYISQVSQVLHVSSSNTFESFIYSEEGPQADQTKGSVSSHRVLTPSSFIGTD